MTLQASVWSPSACKRKGEDLYDPQCDIQYTSRRHVSMGASRSFGLHSSIAVDFGDSCLCCILFMTLVWPALLTITILSDFFTKQGHSFRPWVYLGCWSDNWWYIYQRDFAAFIICRTDWSRTPLLGSNRAIWLASCILGKKFFSITIRIIQASIGNPTFLWHYYIFVGSFNLSPSIKNSLSTLSRITAWKAYEFWKREVNTPLFDIIWRDGLLYFFAIFSMNAANVIIFLAAPKTLRPVNLTWIWFNSIKFIVIWFWFPGPLSYWKSSSPVV